MALADIVTDNGGGESGQTGGGHIQEAPNWSPVPPYGTPNAAGGGGGAVPTSGGGAAPDAHPVVAEGDGKGAVQVLGDPNAFAAQQAAKSGGGPLAPVNPSAGTSALMAFLSAHKTAILLGLLAGIAALFYMNRKKTKKNPSRKVRHHARKRTRAKR